MKKTGVLIVDDHNIVRQGLRTYLTTKRHIEVLGDVSTIGEALDFIAYHKPDVTLLDYNLPDGNGIDGCIKIKAIHPDGKVIMLTGHADVEVTAGAYQAGVDAFLLKDVDGDNLIKTIMSFKSGKDYIVGLTDPVHVNDRLQKDFNLGTREIAILDMISMGKLNREIAETLQVSEKTVRNNISGIFKKINVNNRTEAASFWLRYTKY